MRVISSFPKSHQKMVKKLTRDTSQVRKLLFLEHFLISDQFRTIYILLGFRHWTKEERGNFSRIKEMK
ncbi:hypothetical protein CDAR_318071 [Caerostris darwini]|uniref:Uncharacterized protein n=1 Tax=Caerostris darwini TaxID=1538125 RepID=A0AAV4T9E1_9ARAC|nr:hypothetical protein CDAR_318071 [Caerostris darwini]